MPSGEQDGVEPVAASGLLMTGDQVTRREPGLRQHRQERQQQRLLQLGDDMARRPALAVSLRRPAQRVLALDDAGGRVGAGHHQAGDLAAGCVPWRQDEVEIGLDELAARSALQLESPLAGHLGVASRVHPVQQLVQLLAELAEELAVRPAEKSSRPRRARQAALAATTR